MKYVMTFENFLIRGKSSDKVIVFDIDDTLIKSDAKVFVVKNNKIVRKLDSQEYNEYKLQKGESFRYDEFTDLNKLMEAELKPYFHTMEREYRKGVHISILTARSNKRMIHSFFLKKADIDIHPDLIFATGDDTSDCSVAEKKAKCIQTLANYGYKTLIFFDDNMDNLKEVKDMGEKLNMKVHIVKAS
jgi:hydroxymethylpyrimidine pyrophosphatase-like HAD family hydrolase